MVATLSIWLLRVVVAVVQLEAAAVALVVF
jgi:hypothetical protein